MEIRQEIGKWGNSLGLRIPSMLVESLGIKQGDDVRLTVEGHALIVTPSKEHSFEEQLASFDMDAACRHYEDCDPIPDDALALIHDDAIGREAL